MKHIVEDIYQFTFESTEQNQLPVNAYLLKDSKIMIDSGQTSLAQFQMLQDELASLGVSISEIECVCLTHHHSDHMGLLKYFPGLTNVVASKNLKYFTSSAYLSQVSRYVESLDLSLEFKNEIRQQLVSEHFNIEAKPLNLISNSDVKFRDISFIGLEGHSSTDMIVCYKNKYLFTGDIIIPKVFFNCVLDLNPQTGTPSTRRRENYLNELNAILELDPELCFPGHSHVLGRQEVKHIVEVTRLRMKRTDKKVLKAKMRTNSISEIVLSVFEPFLQYSYFLPFSEVTSVLDEYEDSERR